MNTKNAPSAANTCSTANATKTTELSLEALTLAWRMGAQIEYLSIVGAWAPVQAYRPGLYLGPAEIYQYRIKPPCSMK